MCCPEGDSAVPVCILTMVGGRPCPKGFEDCSQTVYQCLRCEGYEYGDPGDLAYEECERCKR